MILQCLKILIFSILGFFLASNVEAKSLNNMAAGTFHYFVRIPASSQTCEQEARDLQDRFLSGAQVLTAESECRGTIDIVADGKPAHLYSLLLTYQAEQEIVPYSAVFGTSNVSTTPGDLDGVYDTYSSCLDDFYQQKQNFEVSTNLKVLDIFCSPVDDIDHVKYKLQIDGIGTNANSLFIFNLSLAGIEDPQVESEIDKLVISLGGKIAKKYSSQIFYYAQTPLTLEYHLLGLFRIENECLAQISSAESLFLNAGAQNIIARCLALPSGYASKFSLEVIHDGLFDLNEDFGNNNKYYSFDECMNEKSRVIQDGGKSIVGGICIPDVNSNIGQYVLDLFSSL